MGSELRAAIINDAVRECRDKGVAPHSGMRLTEVLEGYDVLCRDGADIADQYFGGAIRFARKTGQTQDMQRLQLFWPDLEGLFPGDPGCDEGVVAEQTPLNPIYRKKRRFHLFGRS